MAHHVANITIYEHPENVSASIKVYRVFDYGAAPARPIWGRYITFEKPTPWHPEEWLREVLERIREQV